MGEDDSLGDDASVMASRLHNVVTALLVAHAPMTEITCRVRRSSDGWYTTRSADLLSIEPEDMSVASRGRALMPLVTVGWEH